MIETTEDSPTIKVSSFLEKRPVLELTEFLLQIEYLLISATVKTAI